MTSMTGANSVNNQSNVTSVTTINSVISMMSKGPYKILRQFARTLFERVEWVGGAAESKKLSDDKNVL